MSGRLVNQATAQVVSFGKAEPPRQQIHLDANANVPVTKKVKHAVLAGLGTSNPSSAHAAGDEARIQLTLARDAVASLCEHVFPEDVIFTSGCTEANNLVVASASATGAALIISAVEHPSIMRAAEAFAQRGGSLTVIPVDRVGYVELSLLSEALEQLSGPTFLSIQAANSETGVVQPLGAIAAIARRRPNVFFHADAAQAFGKIRLSVGEQGPDAISVSAHKLHGPMGVGALLLREGEDRLSPLLFGGDQERGLRAGTQSMPLIAGFAAACEARATNFANDNFQMAALRDRLEAGLQDVIPSIVVNGAEAPRLPNTSNLQFPGVDGMALLALLDDSGILASQGSACHSRRPEPSPVLMAMGLSEDQAFSSIRFSVSPFNTAREIDAAIDLIVAACHRLGLRA